MPEEQPPAAEDSPITPEAIAQAEQIIGLSFTESERQQMKQTLGEQRGQYARIRSVQLENHTPMALWFDPRSVQLGAPAEVPRKYVASPQPALERPDDLEALAFLPVTQLAELIRTRQVTATELTQMYLSRLKRYDSTLQCVVTLTEDLALAQARRADEEIAAGQYRGPLHGIPWGAKDLLAARRYPTTWGATPWKDQQIDIDASVVQRLEAAGAVLVAKLTLGALAYGDIWFGGQTRNPWDTSEGSSGSSAGPGAATAAGVVGFSIGSETYGSIVSPSTRCGVTGLRPTFGRVSRHGAMALSWSMDKIGPMCRSVEDCALVFTAIYGPDRYDPSLVDVPFHWQPDLDIGGLRIGYLESAFAAEYDNKANDDQTLDVLRDLGIDLIPVELPDIDVDALLPILMAEAAAAFDLLTRSDQDDLLQWQDDGAWPNTFRAARLIPAVEYVNANRIRVRLMEAMAELMGEVDVFVTPSRGKALLTTNLTGHPAVVLPNGFTDKRTPTSITFVGGLDREAETLTVARAYQQATGFHQRHPSLESAPAK